jgi:GNAT superfamily N-acetyltransferase
MIRLATHYDIDGIAALFKLCANDDSIDETHWSDEAALHLASETSFTLVAEDDGALVGFFVGRIAFEPTLHGRVCIEHHWYASKYGTELRRAAERAAKERGAVKMLIHSSDDRVKKLVVRAGYEKVYTIYGRAL